MIVVLPNGRAATDVTARDPIPKQSPAFAAGRHDFKVWKSDLYRFAQLLFREPDQERSP